MKKTDPKQIIITGRVKKGQGQGKKTGLKTANLNASLAKNKKLPKGLYTCQVALGNKEYGGLLYYGYNSLTKKDCMEIHILNFSGDIYGKKLTATIGQYLRSPKKFNSIEKLAEQIRKDLKLI